MPIGFLALWCHQCIQNWNVGTRTLVINHQNETWQERLWTTIEGCIHINIQLWCLEESCECKISKNHDENLSTSFGCGNTIHLKERSFAVQHLRVVGNIFHTGNCIPKVQLSPCVPKYINCLTIGNSNLAQWIFLADFCPNSVIDLLWEPGDIAYHQNSEPTSCCKPPRYVPYKCTYVPYDGTFGVSDQGRMLDVWGWHPTDVNAELVVTPDVATSSWKIHWTSQDIAVGICADLLDHTGWIQGWIQFNGCSVC